MDNVQRVRNFAIPSAKWDVFIKFSKQGSNNYVEEEAERLRAREDGGH